MWVRGLGWWLTAVVAAWIGFMGCGAARADAVLLVEDPINLLGRITATGHSTVLMERLCTDDHVSVRWCRAGENGVVVGRYEGVPGGFDWLAMDARAYLFSMEEGEPPAKVTPEQFRGMQAAYRAKHAGEFRVDPGDGVWVQITGESYRRRIVGIRVHTTEADDARMMAWLNRRRNVSHYRLFYPNCADFTGQMLGVLFPGSVHRSYLFDAGIMTPKQVEASLYRYAMRHPEVGWEPMLLPQVAGLRRSRRLYGVLEAYLKVYWFLLPLDYLVPYELVPISVFGLCDRRYVAKPEVEWDGR